MPEPWTTMGAAAGDLFSTMPDSVSAAAKPPPPVIDAAAIARRSKSNLAFALGCLPAERRRDMITFYAFCRIVDDIADEEGFSLKDRRIQLAAWRRVVRGEQSAPDEVARDVVALPQKYGFSAALLEEIIDGVSMDLENRRYETFAELQTYCYKVASVVGLVSLAIFGVDEGEGRDYAVNLGYGLQLTNILRDVRVDWENDGRLYLPLEDMARFGYTVEDVAARRHNAAFEALMKFEAGRAGEFYAKSRAAMPKNHRGRLLAAEAMRQIYHGILVRMQEEGYRVYEKRYRLTKGHKAFILISAWVRGLFAR